jgi:ABC-type polysaccharide transport system permease subunit
MFIAMTRAFTNWSSKRYTAADMDFVGFENFKKMISEGYFLIGVKNVVILMLTGFAKTLTMPVIAAWLVYSFKSDKKKYIYRFMFVLPIVVPGLVGSLLWKQIYNPQGGLDQILVALGLEEWIHVWLGEEKVAIWSIVFMGPPYIGAMPFLLYYGGFTSIDASLYEAARIDGASRLQILWFVNLPGILPTVIITFLLQVGRLMNLGYTKILLLQNDLNLEVSTVISTYTYEIGLLGGQYSYSSAIGLFNNIVNITVLLIANYISRKVSETSLV